MFVLIDVIAGLLLAACIVFVERDHRQLCRKGIITSRGRSVLKWTQNTVIVFCILALLTSPIAGIIVPPPLEGLLTVMLPLLVISPLAAVGIYWMGRPHVPTAAEIAQRQEQQRVDEEEVKNRAHDSDYWNNIELLQYKRND